MNRRPSAGYAEGAAYPLAPLARRWALRAPGASTGWRSHSLEHLTSRSFGFRTAEATSGRLRLELRLPPRVTGSEARLLAFRKAARCRFARSRPQPGGPRVIVSTQGVVSSSWSWRTQVRGSVAAASSRPRSPAAASRSTTAGGTASARLLSSWLIGNRRAAGRSNRLDPARSSGAVCDRSREVDRGIQPDFRLADADAGSGDRELLEQRVRDARGEGLDQVEVPPL